MPRIACFLTIFLTTFAILGSQAEPPKESFPIYPQRNVVSDIPILHIPAPVRPDIQVDIKKENRIYNKTGSQCGWCSLETLGRHLGIEALYDLTDKQKGLINSSNGPRELNRRNVKFILQRMGNKDVSIFRKYVREKQYGAAIGLRGTHMIVLCHFDEEKKIVKVIDNAGSKALKVQTWTMQRFLRLWDGTTYVVIP